MPNRLIKESINESRGLTSCTFFAQDLYKRLITYADDYGRFNADPQIMLARLYPRELAVVSLEDLMDALVELTGNEKIAFYTSSGRKEVYGAFPKWGEHQRLRDSKKRMPEPDDSEINDWYLRRFIPMEMKIEIIKRDKYKCKLCGKHIAETDDPRRLIKMGAGLFHIDHIVPCAQGGRATLENLRLTCPACNLSRKKVFSFDEILAFTNGMDLPQVAASCGELPPESESNPNTNTNTRAKRERFTPPTVEEVQAYCEERRNGIDAQAFIDHYSASGWMRGKTPIKDWKACVRTWEQRRSNPGTRTGGAYSFDDVYERF